MRDLRVHFDDEAFERLRISDRNSANDLDSLELRTRGVPFVTVPTPRLPGSLIWQIPLELLLVPGSFRAP